MAIRNFQSRKRLGAEKISFDDFIYCNHFVCGANICGQSNKMCFGQMTANR